MVAFWSIDWNLSSTIVNHVMPPMLFPMPLLFITAVKEICAINTFEKLLNILFREVYCWYFGFTTLLFSATITDMSLYEVLNLFPRWPPVLWSFLHPPLVARDISNSHLIYARAWLNKDFVHSGSIGHKKGKHARYVIKTLLYYPLKLSTAQNTDSDWFIDPLTTEEV